MEDLKFTLEFKLNQNRESILKSPFWEAKKRYKQLLEYYKEKAKAMDNEMKNVKRPSTGEMIGTTRMPSIPKIG